MKNMILLLLVIITIIYPSKSIASSKKICDCMKDTITCNKENFLTQLKIMNDIQCAYRFKNATKLLKEDREVALEVVKRHGLALSYLSEVFKKDKEIVLSAINNHSSALEYAHKSMKRNRDFALTALLLDPVEYKQSMGLAWEGNKNFILEAVEKGLSIKSIPFGFYTQQESKEICLALVNKDGLVLKFIKENSRSGHLYNFSQDKDIALTAVKQNGAAIEFVNKDLKQDKDIALAAVLNYPHAMNFIDKSYRKNKDFFLSIVEQHVSYALTFMDKSLQNKDFILMLMKKNGLALEYVKAKYQNDEDVVLTAWRQNAQALKFADSNVIAKIQDVIYKDSKRYISTLFKDIQMPSTKNSNTYYLQDIYKNNIFITVDVSTGILKVKGIENKIIFLLFNRFTNKRRPSWNPRFGYKGNMDQMNELQKKYRNKLLVIEIDIEGLSEDELLKFLKKAEVNHVVIPNQTAKSFIDDMRLAADRKNTEKPLVFIIDSKGVIQYIEDPGKLSIDDYKMAFSKL